MIRPFRSHYLPSRFHRSASHRQFEYAGYLPQAVTSNLYVWPKSYENIVKVLSKDGDGILGISAFYATPKVNKDSCCPTLTFTDFEEMLDCSEEIKPFIVEIYKKRVTDLKDKLSKLWMKYL